MLKQAFALATLGAAFALPVVAIAQPAGADTPVQADPNSESGQSYRATELLNSNVRGEDGQVLAEIEDFVLDSETNQIQYVVLAYGNVQAEDAQFYVVPANQFFVQREADVVYLQTPLTVDVIKRAPAFPRAQWTTVIRRPQWRTQVNQFWTGAGVNVDVNRPGFGRRGQIDVDVNVDPNRPNPNRPNPNRPNPPGNLNPDQPGAPSPNPGAANPDRPRGPRPNAPGAGNPPGPAGGPGAGNPPGPAGGPGAGNANPPGPAGGPGAGPNADGGANLPGRR